MFRLLSADVYRVRALIEPGPRGAGRRARPRAQIWCPSWPSRRRPGRPRPGRSCGPSSGISGRINQAARPGRGARLRPAPPRPRTSASPTPWCCCPTRAGARLVTVASHGYGEQRDGRRGRRGRGDDRHRGPRAPPRAVAGMGIDLRYGRAIRSGQRVAERWQAEGKARAARSPCPGCPTRTARWPYRSWCATG